MRRPALPRTVRPTRRPGRTRCLGAVASALACAALLAPAAVPAADAAPRFARVCADGSSTCADAAWACTRDVATGLTWQRIPPAAREQTYSNFSEAYDPGRERGKGYEAHGVLAAANAARLCGASDWRLPTRSELLTLLAYPVRAGQPAFDAAAFGDDLSADPKKRVLWSETGFAGDESHAWAIDFDGGVSGDDHRSAYYAVRLVRGALAATWRAIAEAGDGGEVIDPARGLAWRRCAEGLRWDATAAAPACRGEAALYDRDEARARAQAEAARAPRGQPAWRLPTVDELASLIDTSRAGPAIDTALFPATPSTWFRSATPDAQRADYDWYVDFTQGHVGPHGFRGDRHALRLVRSLTPQEAAGR